MKRFSFFVTRFFLNRCVSYALQPNGILGPMLGQIGKILVGFKWKDKKVLRSYVIPTNPQTAAQTAQRQLFFLCQQMAKILVETVTKPFWNFLSSSMSGFNSFISVNTKRVSSWTDFANIVVTQGSYEPLKAFSTAVYTSGSGDLTLTWDSSIESIGDDSDQVVAVAVDKKDWDPANGDKILIPYVDTSAVRSDGTVSLSLPTGLTPANIECFLGLRNPTTEAKIKTANSVYKQATA